MQQKHLYRSSVPFIFHRFCRRGYAAFASMHREVCIGVLTVGMLASVQLPKVQARQLAAHPEEEGDTDDRELAELTVSGTLSPLAALQAARIVGVITRQQIESSAAQTVNDLLKSVAGLDVRQRGGFGIQTDISINGSSFDQIIILLNGVDISSPHTGHLAADFPVSLTDIERIEILEGAASRIYGPSAFGGAINVVTRGASPSPVSEGKKASFDAGVQGGSHGTFGADARAAVGTKLLPLGGKPTVWKGFWEGASFSTSYLRSDGATQNSDFSRFTAFLRGVTETEALTFDVQAGYSQKAYGANTFYSAAYPNQWESNHRFIVSAGAQTKGQLRVRPEVFWNRLYDHFQLIRDAPTAENYHRSDVLGARLTAEYHWAAGQTTLGAELRKEAINSSSLGKPQGEGGSPPYTHHDSRTNLSITAGHTIRLSQWTISAGLLAFMPLPLGGGREGAQYSTLAPGLDLAYTPTPRWRLFASYNKGFRLPTFTDLYYKSPTHEGNQGMRPEVSHSFQLGFQHHFLLSSADCQFTGKAFYHRGNDLIDWVMYAPDDVFHSANFALENLGFQIQGDFHLAPLSVNLSYAFIHQHRRDDLPVWKSNYAMEYLRHKVVGTVNHPITSRLSASWTFRCQDRNGGYILYENAQSTGRQVPYDPYATLDLRLRWTLSHCLLWADATNLFNRRYYDLGNIPQPGFQFLAGIRVNL